MTAQPDGFHGYVAVQRCGVIALPSDLRERLHLDEPGVQLEVTERADGVVELRPTVPVPADQEVDEHVAAGRVTTHESADDFLAHVDELTE